ncbi:hypothetical protein HK101_001935 [Irineochytrium annulatum]|nr:hypothetical protein HK101_001935 [Irineochytrium annulatum]
MTFSSTETVADSEYIPVAINSKIETEEVLGPLPENWERAEILEGGKKKYYYVNNKSKTTSWIDPRTSLLRKHNINDIVAGELPYGWEEAYDEDFGIYYVDHITHTNYAEPPWNEEVKEKVVALKAKLKIESRKSTIKDQQEKQSLANKAKVKDAEKAIAVLEAQKKRLDEVAQDDDEYALDERDVEIDAKIQHLKGLNDKLDQENRLLASEVENNGLELGEIRQMIEAERAQRAALESYVMQLKQELLHLSSAEDARLSREQDEDAAAESAMEEADMPSLEDEGEIRNLRARLELEQQERLKLRELTESLLKEKEDNQGAGKYGYNVPSWVREIDVHARAKILRQKIVNGGINPDSLDFKGKLDKFAARKDSKPKVPNQNANPTSEHAVRARETAFGRADVEYSEGAVKAGRYSFSIYYGHISAHVHTD